MSGRRSSKSEGTPSGTGTGVNVSGRTGTLKVEAGLPVSTAMACSNCSRCCLHQIELRYGGVEQRLLLRQVQSGSHAARSGGTHQLQTLLLDGDRVLHDLWSPHQARAG